MVGQSASKLLKAFVAGVVLQLVDDRKSTVVEHQDDQFFWLSTDEYISEFIIMNEPSPINTMVS